jgi:hypothetical protein
MILSKRRPGPYHVLHNAPGIRFSSYHDNEAAGAGRERGQAYRATGVTQPLQRPCGAAAVARLAHHLRAKVLRLPLPRALQRLHPIFLMYRGNRLLRWRVARSDARVPLVTAAAATTTRAAGRRRLWQLFNFTVAAVSPRATARHRPGQPGATLRQRARICSSGPFAPLCAVTRACVLLVGRGGDGEAPLQRAQRRCSPPPDHSTRYSPILSSNKPHTR